MDGSVAAAASRRTRALRSLHVHQGASVFDVCGGVGHHMLRFEGQHLTGTAAADATSSRASSLSMPSRSQSTTRRPRKQRCTCAVAHGHTGCGWSAPTARAWTRPAFRILAAIRSKYPTKACLPSPTRVVLPVGLAGAPSDRLGRTRLIEHQW